MTHLPLWQVIAACVPLAILLVGVGGWLLLDWQRTVQQNRIAARFAMKHYKPDDHQDHAPTAAVTPISVAELLERAASEGAGIRLHWTEEDTDPHGYARYREDDWPTVVLPRIVDE
ncbi:hypothetical protein [Actinokineospora sp. HUAS TT18]|uniref:hypothetical protein n=1 Tax=Actinokineospora sp. HUAS TT18 TaxID=3447451 RepID=UPI003F52111C